MPFIKERRTLGKYYGCEVKIICEFQKNTNIVKYNEYNPNNLISHNPMTGYVHPITISDNNIPTKPIKFIDKASVVIKVKGVNGFEDINEDHLIIQKSFNNIKKGERLFIVGQVQAYTHDKKQRGFDYCLNVRYYEIIST
ncbi:hypothetical protein CACET_c27280 [Clostridium aceticum]|uniref:Uncharacterized protein n=1 Tax=Clostridium aceticum TaxID=84022 RepID=A0A0D8I969_9CLOT|nr:hypothetical protein [Clostridium aceticum]AKL96173.1 hypothetical protein CACET_c27280 [Clostridium aceticum]KJF26594.1 hypothetical protein TZ02_12010 [Clostridium aceticum]